LTNLYIVKDFPQVNVSSVKTLHLDKVSFHCHTYMINFFLAFPVLEELQTNFIDTFDRAEPRDMIKCLPNLVRANITDDPELIPLLSFSRALVFKLTQETWHLKTIHVPFFNNLTQMELFINFHRGKWILKVLQHTPKLEHLIIHHNE
ncbi:hypothetical protein RYX36_013152, partial [Vicia faba]